jgi:hypothetical protein
MCTRGRNIDNYTLTICRERHTKNWKTTFLNNPMSQIERMQTLDSCTSHVALFFSSPGASDADGGVGDVLAAQVKLNARRLQVEGEQGCIRVASGSGYRLVTPFPWRLHQMLQDIEQRGLLESSWLVSWDTNGKSFAVHDTEMFTRVIVPEYFNQKSFKSFTRQCYIYGFRRLQGGKAKGK